MFCKTCGNNLEENTKVCPACGSVQQVFDNSLINNNDDYSSINKSSKNDKINLSIAAFTLGISSVLLSFTCCIPINLICGIVGIILGIISIKSSKKVLSIVGICLSGISVIIFILSIIFLVCIFTMPQFRENFNNINPLESINYFQELQ